MNATALRRDGRDVFALRMKLQTLPAGSAESWVEMAYESVWKGHPSGEFAFTPETLNSIVALFDADPQSLPVTYGHPDHSGGSPVPAAGWIREMEVRQGTEGAELWGRVEWTERAAQHIKSGEYRFCSVVVDFAPIDRASGEPSGAAEMYELALTNSPFLPGMQPITLSRVGAPARSHRSLAMNDPKKVAGDVAKALGLKKDASPEEIKAMLDAVLAFVAAAAGSSAKPADAAPAAAELSRVLKLADPMLPEVEAPEAPAEEAADPAMEELMAKLVEITGMDHGALMSALLEKADQVAAVLAAAPVSGMSAEPVQTATLARTSSDARIVELTARVNELGAYKAKHEAEQTEARIVAAFARLLTEGKVADSERDVFLKCSAESETITLAQYDSRPAIVPTAVRLATGPKAAPAGKTGKPTADAADPMTVNLRANAKALGMAGPDADAWVTKALAIHNDRNKDA